MGLVERRRELDEVLRLLDRAGVGSGGVLVVTGPAGSGRTALADAAIELARSRGFEVFRGLTVGWRADRWVWAQLVRDVSGRAELAERLLAGPAMLDLDAAAAALCAGDRRLIVVDDLDRAGPDAVEVLAVLASRAVAGSVAILVTSRTPLGIGSEVWLRPLSPAGIAVVTGETRAEVRDALWSASHGLPGPARALAATIDPLANGDPVVALALSAGSVEGFLEVDVGLVRLLETALARTSDDANRARLSARLAAALLGDPSATARRQRLIADALVLGRHSADPALLAELLDARLYALWDSDGANDRLAFAGEIIELAGGSVDWGLERRGLFWRFVALMELGRVGAAELALATFGREAQAAGDAAAAVMVLSRHAMLAVIRGRFDEAQEFIGGVAEQGRRVGLADTDRLVGTIWWSLVILRGDPPRPAAEAGLQQIQALARRSPGHLYEATVARCLLALGRVAEAGLELERALPSVLAGSGPRWLGAVADLAAVAVATDNTAAAALLYPALAPYRGRLVVWAGANTVTGSVAHYLGALAQLLGRPDDATTLLGEAISWAEGAGTLPFLANSLATLSAVLASRNRPGDPVLAAALRRRAQDIADRLGMLGLLSSLTPPADEWSLRRDGPDWLLEAGLERARLRAGRGVEYLRALLAAPGQEITALDLVAGGAGLSASTAEPVLDRAAREAYRRRLALLQDELDVADATADVAHGRRAAAERDTILAELRRASGLGGRARGVSGPTERARVNVTRSLRATIEQITVDAPTAGAHLSTSIHTGRACRYQPVAGGPVRWHV